MQWTGKTQHLTHSNNSLVQRVQYSAAGAPVFAGKIKGTPFAPLCGLLRRFAPCPGKVSGHPSKRPLRASCVVTFSRCYSVDCLPCVFLCSTAGWLPQLPVWGCLPPVLPLSAAGNLRPRNSCPFPAVKKSLCVNRRRRQVVRACGVPGGSCPVPLRNRAARKLRADHTITAY